VSHVPTAPGTHLATLRVAGTGGGVLEAALQGFAYGGTTRFAWDSEPGDWIGGGGHLVRTVADTYMWPMWMLDHMRVLVEGLEGIDGGWWGAEFAAATGQPFAPGTYTGATRWPFHEPGPGLAVDGNGHGCNKLTGQFTVHEVAFNAFGEVARFGASYEQHCEGAAPALRGDVYFRFGDATPPAPWVRDGPITSIQPSGLRAPGKGTGPTSSSRPPGIASVGRLRLVPRVFRAAPAGPAIVAARYGTRVRLSVNRKAAVRFVVKRVRGKVVGRFTRRFKAGPNGFRFRGRLGGKRLRPGRYRMVATPFSSGRRGHHDSASFRVVG
jgi:hypothetical protein